MAVVDEEGLDWGCKEEQQDIFLVERPVLAKEGHGHPLKSLKPKAGDVFVWSFGGKDGLVTVPGLVITKTAQELKVIRK